MSSLSDLQQEAQQRRHTATAARAVINSRRRSSAKAQHQQQEWPLQQKRSSSRSTSTAARTTSTAEAQRQQKHSSNSRNSLNNRSAATPRRADSSGKTAAALSPGDSAGLASSSGLFQAQASSFKSSTKKCNHHCWTLFVIVRALLVRRSAVSEGEKEEQPNFVANAGLKAQKVSSSEREVLRASRARRMSFELGLK